MNKFPRPSRSPLRAVRLFLAGLTLCGTVGCTFLHNYGSGTHLDAPPDKAPHHGTAKASTMQIEVTTDAAAQVVAIHIVRSSGSDAVDGFVANSIQHNWPGGPSTRSLVEVHYAPGTGFSAPRLISSTPAT